MRAMKTFVILFLCASVASAADYPVAFLAHPLEPTVTNGWFHTQSVSENSGQYQYRSGTDLMLQRPDGTESVLVSGLNAATGMLAVHDFVVSLDAQSIVYSQIHTISGAAGVWCDLYRVDIATGTVTQLTDALTEWEPPRGSGQFASTTPATQTIANTDRVNKGIHFQTVWNMAPCICGDGSIMFCSNRQSMRSPSEGSQPAFQLFRMDADGKHCRLIGHMNLAGALHPSVAKSGKIYWSSAEQQGGRMSHGNGWGIWSINPDGSDWGPELSAFNEKNPFHFQTETSDGSLVNAEYYDTRVYGTLRVSPLFTPDPFGPPTKFGHPLVQFNAMIPQGYWGGQRYSYMRRGFYSPVPWSTNQDKENRNTAGTEKPGMVSHPQAIPNNGIFLTWTGDKGDSLMDLGVYAIADITQPATHHSQLSKVVDQVGRHEWMGHPVVPFAAIYGIESPPVPVGLRASDLAPGSPFGVVSTSSLAWPEIAKPSIAGQNQSFSNFTLSDAQYLRILAFNKTSSNTSYMFSASARSANNAYANTDGFASAFNERCGIYGEIPIYKYRTPAGLIHYGPDPPDGSTAILDPEGKPDTSFRLEIPADQPWTFQVLNAKKESVGTAQTWHQVIPGEYRTCGGCHTHFGRVPFDFSESFAATPEYTTPRLDTISLTVWGRDVKPIVDEFGLAISPLDAAWPTVTSIKAYNSDETSIDDDPRLSRAQAETIRRWIDTGMMSEGVMYDYRGATSPEVTRAVVESDRLGPYADSQGPTVSHAVCADQIILGLFDPQAGINLPSLSVTCTDVIEGRPAGENLADLFVAASDHRWILTTTVPQTASLTVSVLDNQVGRNLYGEAVGPGNRTKISFPLSIGSTPPPPPPPDPDAEEIARLQAEIAAIDEQISLLKSVRADLQAEIDILLGN